MKYKTINLDAFSVVGVKEFTSVENGENFTKIPQMRANLKETILMTTAVCGVKGIASCLIPALETYDNVE